MQKRVIAASKTADGKDLAQLSRSLVALEMLKLRLKMKPAPKPVDVSKITTASPARERGAFGSES